MPDSAIAFYSRWWQLETWLRSLVYLELRAAYGVRWVDKITQQTLSRVSRDEVNRYMASPDAENLLSYIDLGELLALIDSDEHWSYFEQSLLPRVRWRGCADELRELRHRSAHCRRPHSDDLARLEQVLRNLEAGARRALRAYGETESVGDHPNDSLSRAWVRNKHRDAARLVEHAHGNYATDFQLLWSARPWADTPVGGVAGAPGILVHAQFRMHEGRTLASSDFWHDGYLTPEDYQLIVHVLRTEPWELTVTFAAVDDPAAIADSIGRCFDSVLTESNPYPVEDVLRTWMNGREELDFRFQIRTATALAHDRLAFSVLAGEPEPYWRPI